MNAPILEPKSCSPSSVRRALAPALALCAAAQVAAWASVSPRAAPAGDEALPSLASRMAELSQDLRTLELALDAEQGAPARAAVRSLADELRLVGELAPALSSDPALALLLAGCDTTLAEMDRLLDAGRFGGARQSLADLRAGCVTCHVQFRDDNAARGMFPARGSTVSGSVALCDAEGRELADRSSALVFLESVAADRAWPSLRDSPAISQENRQFHPRVLPVVVGTSVDFPNDDFIFHNVFSLSKARPFDLGTYEPGQSRSVQMSATGLVKVYCNIHPEMQASVVVLGNPWYALTDARGRFVITGVEDGEYTLRLWNDRGAEARRALKLQGGEWVAVELQGRETVRVLSHRNKHGKPYQEKY